MRKDWLDSQEYHELCMDYRGASSANAENSFQILNAAIREHFIPKGPISPTSVIHREDDIHVWTSAQKVHEGWKALIDGSRPTPEIVSLEKGAPTFESYWITRVPVLIIELEE